MLPTVIVDANCIVQRDWLLTTAAWQVLSYRSRHVQCSLVVPEIVVRETVGAYRRAVASAVDKAQAAIKAVGQLGVAAPTLDIEQIMADTDIYDHRLRRAIEAANGTTPDPPDISLLSLVDRAIERRRPFNSKGSGFRDALVWEHVLASLVPNRLGPVCLISADRSAFGREGDPGLADDLLADLESLGYESDAVQLYGSIAEFLQATGTQDPVLTAQVTALVEAEHAQLSEHLSAVLQGTRAEPLHGLDDIIVETVDEPIHFRVAEVTAPAGEGEGLVLVDFRAEADVVLHVDAWTSRPPRTLTVRDTIFFGFTATYRADEKTLDNVTLGPLVIDLEELLEDRPRPLPGEQVLPW